MLVPTIDPTKLSSILACAQVREAARMMATVVQLGDPEGKMSPFTCFMVGPWSGVGFIGLGSPNPFVEALSSLANSWAVWNFLIWS